MYITVHYIVIVCTVYYIIKLYLIYFILFYMDKLLDKPNDTIAEFLHMPGKFFTNFDDVREEIIKQTKQLAGEGKVKLLN